MLKNISNTKYLKNDIASSFVVFLIAIPLCLGIALASNAPLFSGLISGFIGGIVVGIISKSPLSVSGPAAGLTAVVVSALDTLPTFQAFLVSVVIAGVIQILLGVFKAGFLGEFIPNTVLKGMLAAVGIIIIIKQVEVLIGYDSTFVDAYTHVDKSHILYEYINGINNIIPLAFIIGLFGILFLIVWEKVITKKLMFLKLVPGGLIVVILGIFINKLAEVIFPEYALGSKHLVNIPIAETPQEFFTFFQFPDFSVLSNHKIWFVALTIALVASVETLLCIEGVDKLDPLKRVTPTNRELIAQGSGNMLSGIIGGLPITSVIVRSSANVNAGGKTKMSTIFHGIFLLLSVIFLANVLNQIPLASLASILVYTGYKLCDVNLIHYQIKRGKDQYYPFIITIVAVLFTDLLIGVLIGVGVSIILLLRATFFHTMELDKKADNEYVLKFIKDITFFNKGKMTRMLQQVPKNSKLTIDQSASHHVDKDVLDLIEEFKSEAGIKNIEVSVIPHKKVY